MSLLDKENLGLSTEIGHLHRRSQAWLPEPTGVIAAIESAKMDSAMNSRRALMANAIGTEWPSQQSREVRVYPINVSDLVEADPSSSLATRFEALADEWEADTAFTSALNELVLHQNYQDIVGMGLPALPFIFERLKESPARWFWALRAIVGHDVAANSATTAEAAERWLAWGHDSGYIS